MQAQRGILMTKKEARVELIRRSFKYSHSFGNREYWKRTDGKPDVFLDHSATITVVGSLVLVSDFVGSA